MEENNSHYHDHSGQRSTAIGLAAGLGGGALLLGIAGLWGLNAASKARSEGAVALANGNSQMIASLNNSLMAERNYTQASLLAERQSREGWQSANTPSIQSYIDVQATPNQTTTASSVAEAAAYAQLYNNNALNSAVGSDNYLKIMRYSAPVPCSCDSCGNA